MEQPPTNDPVRLAEFLVRQLTNLQHQIDNSDVLDGLTALPAKPKIGKLYYFKNTIGSTITAVGVWTYKSTGWAFLG